MRNFLLLFVSVLILTSTQQINATNSFDPIELQTVESLNQAFENNELTIIQLKQLASNGKISPTVLNEFNELQQTKIFSKNELETFEQSYYGSIAKDYVKRTDEYNPDNQPTKATKNIQTSTYDLKFEEQNNTGSSHFGYSVSTAGDVNNDGYDDIIIGANNFSSLRGRAYIYYGGASMDSVADVIMTGEAAYDFFGSSVSSIGDVNKDGYDDVIIGAKGYSSYTGRAYIYFGGTNMDNIADITITGETDDDKFGISVSKAGDVNNDGYDDIIVGASVYSSSKGRAYIYFGGESMDNTADVIMTGEASYNSFGLVVSTAGDVNNDNYDDIIVGAQGYSNNTGRAYIFYGGTSMDNTADVTMTGGSDGDYFGCSVASAGNINNDEFDDVIVGAHGFYNDEGRVFIYYGGTSMDNSADWYANGEVNHQEFGKSVSSAGDVNNDGFDDVIVGACKYSFKDNGRAYIYYGGISMDNTVDVTITGHEFNYVGRSVSSADINNDGYNDVIISADGYSNNRGRTYICYGGVDMDNFVDVSLTGELTNSQFGKSVSFAGDVNNDGYDDVIVGSPDYSVGTGRAYIYYGGLVMDIEADVIITGQGKGNYFGKSVSSAGDVNNDGYDDVIIGADGYSTSTGRTYIYYGSTNMDNVADVIMTGEDSRDYFGRSVSSAGDVNNDGYDDVIVGAYLFMSYKGRAYIYYGSKSMDNTADVVMTGTSGDRLGCSVSSAGDVNNDDYDDVIVGASHAGSGLTGCAYIYYGGTSMDNTTDVTMTGENSSDYFGNSVSLAGDVNNDNFDDVIVGAYGYSDNIGRAYVYFGGSSMDNTSDLIMTGENTDDYFGYSVSSAGDVNNDDYSDVIVGAYGYSDDKGCAYIFNGSATMDNIADNTVIGEAPYIWLGQSVSYTGDIYNNGNSQIILGVSDLGNNGAAYIYGPAVPNVTSQPSDKIDLCPGDNISFSISADDATDFQWQVSSDNGNTFNNLSSDGVYSNVTSANLNITSLNADMDNYQYRCIASSIYGSDVSNAANLFIENENPVPDSETLSDLTGTCSVSEPNAPTATDNCTGSITGTTTTTFPITNTCVITWTYDDGNGNIITQNQNIIIEDITAPVPDVATLSDLSDQCSISEPTAPTATDNCAGSITGTTTTTFPITTQGTTVVTWTYNDGNGNVTTQSQNVIIDDITAPDLNCVENQIRYLSAGESYYTVSGTEFDLSNVNDNCEIASITNDFNSTANLADAQIPAGTTTIIWTVIDVAGNHSNCNYDIVVNNNVGLNELEKLGILVYPNPTHGIIKLNFAEKGVQKIRVSDITGKIVFEKVNVEQNEVIDLSIFVNGIYLIILETDKGIVYSKIIKE